MRKLIFIIFMLVVSCKTGCSASEHLIMNDYDNYPVVFLNPTYNGIVHLVNDKKVIPLQNNLEEGNFILFSLIKKDESWFEVIAWNSSDESFIGIGKILSNAPICIYSRQYTPKENPLKLYAKPDLKSSFISDTIYHTEELEVVDFYNKWLQIKIVINNKIYIKWLPPDMQCANVYSTCN